MEIEIPFSVKVSLAEDKANINDVVKSLRRVLDETGRNTGTDSITREPVRQFSSYRKP